jgi:sortase A
MTRPVADTDAAPVPDEVPSSVVGTSWWVRLSRVLGWVLLAAGVVVLLYIVYLMFYTNLVTDRAQESLQEAWELEYGTVDETAQAAPAEPAEPAEPVDPPPASPAPVDVGDAYAVMWFERPGSAERPVHADPLFVVEGVDPETLKQGPGHYPGTAAPGQPGNFALAGHRTTYGAPFFHLDQLRAGDEVHVVDRQQRSWVYEVTESRVVLPHETWVIGPDPLDSGRPVMSFTTCEPHYSAEKRLIVFAELRDDGS